jgi:phosphonate transport system substrate-binding protein
VRRRTLLSCLALAPGLFCVGSAARAALVPLRLGIMPFNSALALLKTHQPLREHLQTVLGRPVEVFTSADYFTFINEVLDQRFDLLIAGPHFGVMSVDKGYLPLFRYRATLQPIFVVRADSGIKTVADLRGKRIGLSSRLSISSIGGVRWLQDQGLQMGRDYSIFERSTHGAAVAGVAVGDLDAAMTTHTPLKQIPEDVRAKVTLLPTDVQVPHLMTLAHRRLGSAEIARIRAALADFSERSPRGRAFFDETAYLGYEPVTAEDIKALRPYVALTRTMMGLAQ